MDQSGGDLAHSGPNENGTSDGGFLARWLISHGPRCNYVSGASNKVILRGMLANDCV